MHSGSNNQHMGLESDPELRRDYSGRIIEAFNERGYSIWLVPRIHHGQAIDLEAVVKGGQVNALRRRCTYFAAPANGSYAPHADTVAQEGSIRFSPSFFKVRSGGITVQNYDGKQITLSFEEFLQKIQSLPNNV